MTTVARTLREAAARFGDRSALWPDGGPTTTYAELWARSARLAAALRADGVDEGAVVALDLPSDPTWIATQAAVSAVGGVAAGINPRLAPPEKARV
ncbi:MAG: AMP-binding protein, partial [Acidimicrobiia bacterium]|nr:AMP-binding protein [Acidimicrobiia bacterium]